MKILLRLLPAIILIIIFFRLISSNKEFIAKIKNYLFSKKEFENQVGQIYKQCRFCGKKYDRTAIKCTSCGNDL